MLLPSSSSWILHFKNRYCVHFWVGFSLSFAHSFECFGFGFPMKNMNIIPNSCFRAVAVATFVSLNCSVNECAGVRGPQS